MKWLEYVRSKPIVRKGLIAGGIAVLAYTLFGFLALPSILKSPLSKTLSETLHRKAEVRDLRQLAMERASRVRDHLVAMGKVETGRIFLVEPKTLPPERKEKLRDSRVDFRIK